MRFLGLGVAMCVSMLVACGGEDGGGGAEDAGGRVDASGMDAGGRVDASGADAGPAADSGAPVEAGTELDAAAVDAGSDPDAGTDGGPADSGTPDAGPEPCTTSLECPSTHFCEARTCEGDGACVRRPEGCGTDYDPVCGCDGTTYPNDCTRQANGVRASRRGACGPGGEDTCALPAPVACCFDDADCPRDMHCYIETCADGGAGVCKPIGHPGSCWDDSDCTGGTTCEGESVCPCGAFCFAPDMPGACGAV